MRIHGKKSHKMRQKFYKNEKENLKKKLINIQQNILTGNSKKINQITKKIKKFFHENILNHVYEGFQSLEKPLTLSLEEMNHFIKTFVQLLEEEQKGEKEKISMEPNMNEIIGQTPTEISFIKNGTVIAKGLIFQNKKKELRTPVPKDGYNFYSYTINKRLSKKTHLISNGESTLIIFTQETPEQNMIISLSQKARKTIESKKEEEKEITTTQKNNRQKNIPQIMNRNHQHIFTTLNGKKHETPIKNTGQPLPGQPLFKTTHNPFPSVDKSV